MSADNQSSTQSLWSDAASSTGDQGGQQSGGQQQQSQGQGGGQQQQSSQSQGQQGGSQQQQGQGQQGQQQQQSSASVQMTADELTKAFIAAQQQQGQQQAQGQQQQQKQLTQEELDKAFNKFNVTEELYAQIFDSEDPKKSIAALNVLVSGAVRQAVTMAHHLMHDRFQQFDGRLKPYMSFADEQRETMLRNQYFEKFPSHKALDPIIQQVHQQLKSEGYKPKDIGTLFTEVGKRVDAIVEQLKTSAGITTGGQGGQGGGQQQQQQSQQHQQQASQKPGMSSLSSGGQGGEPGGSGSGGDKNKVKSLWS